MGDLRDRLEGPNVESTYECAHCGVGHHEWCEDCPACGGVLTRIVTDRRDDEPPNVE